MSGGAMVPTVGYVTPSLLVIHETRGLKKSAGEIGERYVCIERLPEDDPAGVAFQVCIHHPVELQTATGRSRQFPEIVYRGNDEKDAKYRYAAYVKLLGGTPTGEYAAALEPKTEPAEATLGRVLELEKELARVLARVEALES